MFRLIRNTILTIWEKQLKNIFPSKKNEWRVFSVCFLGAVLWWFFHELNKTHTVNLSYPIKFKYDTVYIPINPLPENIYFQLSASGWQILPLYIGLGLDELEYTFEDFFNSSNKTDNDYRSIIDKTTGQITIDISEASLKRKLAQTSRGLNPNSLDELQLVFDLVDSKKLKVQIKNTIPIAKNFKISGKISIQPAYINLKGSKYALSKLPDNYEIIFPNQKIKEDFSASFPVKLPPDIATQVQKDNDAIKISFQVQEFEQKRGEIPIRKVAFPDNIQLEKPNISFLYAIPKNQSKSEKELLDNFIIVANFNKYNTKDSTITLEILKIPKSVYIEDIQLAQSKVKIHYENTP